MKKYLFFTASLALFIFIFLSACSKNEPDIPQPSPRDGVYEGENLTVTIDGEPATTIKSVKISSQKIPYANGIGVGDNGGMEGKNPVYDTSIVFEGFPETREEITLKTVSTLFYFDGDFQLTTEENSVRYFNYVGSFTGDPASPHSEQGLILEFISIDNPF